jgi:CO dehydrogenase nickel-insertion accessory protein CooC1
MPLGYPLVVVTGSKGGTGTTTLVAGLLLAAREWKARIAGVDLTGTNDLSRVLGRRAVSISSLLRYRGRMPAATGRALERSVALLGLDPEAAMYSDRLVEMLRLLAARRPIIVDAGSAFATTGARPLLPYLSLATHIVLASVPDVRSVARTEHLLRNWTAHRDRVLVVENAAVGSPSFSGAASIPMAPAADIERLMRTPAGDAIRAMARDLLPCESANAEAEETSLDRGIIRSLIARLTTVSR